MHGFALRGWEKRAYGSAGSPFHCKVNASVRKFAADFQKERESMHENLDERLPRALQQGGKARIDSRAVQPGDIFFGLPGEHFDGSQFAAQALAAGAAVAVVGRGQPTEGERVIECEHPLRMLQALARWRRAQLKVPVIAITGSSGKTTTKELLVAALSATLRVAATEGNLNNEIGVPLTLANLPWELDAAVVEMGASHEGDIAMLCDLTRPTHGLITFIGRAHLAGFGSLEGVARAKGELFEYLKRTGGVSFTREDDPRVNDLAARLHMGCMSVGYSLAGYGVEVERGDQLAPLELKMQVNGKTYRVRTQLVGDYNASNVVAALHVAYYFNVPLEVACRAIADYAPSNHRSQLLRTSRNGVVVDCYNANPSSMAAALESFARCDGRLRWAILGEMREMGAASEKVHGEVAERAERLLGGRVLYVGPGFRGIAPAERWFADAEALREYLRHAPIVDAEVLVKGSRGVALEAILPEL